MAMKTSAFCKSRKKSCDKIQVGNTYHIKFKNQFQRADSSEESVFWELHIFSSPISLFFQHRVRLPKPIQKSSERYTEVYLSQLWHGTVIEKTGGNKGFRE